MTLVVLSDGRHIYLHDEHLLKGVADQEAEGLVPLGGPGAIAHLWKKKTRKKKTNSQWLSKYSSPHKEFNCMSKFCAFFLTKRHQGAPTLSLIFCSDIS